MNEDLGAKQLDELAGVPPNAAVARILQHLHTRVPDICAHRVGLEGTTPFEYQLRLDRFGDERTIAPRIPIDDPGRDGSCESAPRSSMKGPAPDIAAEDHQPDVSAVGCRQIHRRIVESIGTDVDGGRAQVGQGTGVVHMHREQIGDATLPLLPSRLPEFKQRIAFDAALGTERLDQHVVMRWDEFPSPPQLRGWMLERDIARVRDGETAVRMTFDRERSRVTVRHSIFDPAERRRVADKLIERADAVMTREITDQRGPADLGTLAVVPRAPATHRMYWIFRNVYSEVVTHNTSVSALDIACWMQRLYERNLRPI